MKALTLRLPDELHEHLRRQAFEQRTSITAVIIDALEQRPKPGTLCDQIRCWNEPTRVVPGGFHFCAEHLPAMYGDVVHHPTEGVASDG